MVYQIKAGDTLAEIAKSQNVPLNDLLASNPGINPNTLQIGQNINIPFKSGAEGHNPVAGDRPSTSGGIPGSTGGTNGGGAFVPYGGPASAYPPQNQWACYDALWKQNKRLIAFHASEEEIAYIKEAIEIVAREANIDVRAILCMIVQESGGDPRVGDTAVTHRNPGLMQSHNGVSFNPADPKGSILQMVRDGVEGTIGQPGGGNGLKQELEKYGNYYEAFRGYNSGSVNKNDLNDPFQATGHYVVNMANRLVGHEWNTM
ncbi:hypothetical protein BGZ60DRAFT_401046 [Tricladium varicosporioides]|nr:hypothetical protein BGZ60DRAFT_401046 [Hymenoscyphus varicosporioides]